MNEVEEFRDKITNLRKKNKLSKSDLARAIDKSPSFICDIESGRKNPSFETAVAIARILDISIDKIINKNYA
jgi:putative transcriptional regulator